MIISLNLFEIFIVKFDFIEIVDKLFNISLAALHSLISAKLGLEVFSNVNDWLKNLFTVEFRSILKQFCLYLNVWTMLFLYALDAL